MSVVLLIARSILALVFAIAALGKLVGREGLRETLSDFGLPFRFAAAGAVALPLAELAVAGLLLPTGSARLGALAALGLLLVFCAAITRVLARGERPECNCFGQVHSARVGGRTLVRNAGLAAAAGLVAAAGPGEGIGGALAGVEVTTVGVAVMAVSVAVAVQGWLSWQLFRQNGRLIERVRALEETAVDVRSRSGLAIGEPAPMFELDDLDGRRRTLAEILAPGRPVALVFSDPDCGACAALAPQLGRLREECAGSLEIAVITRGEAAENKARLGDARLEHVLLQQDREVLAAYRVQAVPSATIVDAEGRVASAIVTGEQAIEELLALRAMPVPERQRAARG